MEVASLSVPVVEPSQVAAARRAAVHCAQALQFDETDTGKVALVATEAATNVLKHGGGGEIVVRTLTADAREALAVEVLALDRGPGMNAARCLADGYSTTGTHGIGLGAVSRASALFDVYSTPQRGTALHLRGVQSDDLYERALRAKEIAQHETIAARKRLEALQVELQAARAGTYLGDSYNDVPSSFQRARELTIRLDETRANLDQLTRKVETLTEQSIAEQKRLIAHTVAALTAPIAGSLWTVQAASGEYVRKGQDLFTVLDCSTVMVTASVVPAISPRVS